MNSNDTRENTANTLEKWETPVLEVIPVKQTQSGGPFTDDGGFDFS